MTCDDTTILLPIDGILDLHTFHPREVKDLVGEYLRACLEREIFEIRIIHGKGTGALRRTVHAALRSFKEVTTFRLAGEDAGGWGATIVTIAPRPLNEGSAGETTGSGHVPRKDRPEKE
jgi:DNA-nicking Smr family endonuclease